MSPKKTTPAKDSVKKDVKSDTSTVAVSLYDITSQKKESFDLSKQIFGLPVKKNLLAQYVYVYLTNQRQGTVSAKTRGEVVGSTKKIYRQKGTGGARHGARKAPLFVGGGVSHGPRPRTFDLKLNSKVIKKIFHMALSSKVKTGDLLVLKDATSIKPKTNAMMDILMKNDVYNRKIILVVYADNSKNMFYASRNIPNVVVRSVKTVNAYDIVKAHVVVMDTESIMSLQA